MFHASCFASAAVCIIVLFGYILVPQPPSFSLKQALSCGKNAASQKCLGSFSGYKYIIASFIYLIVIRVCRLYIKMCIVPYKYNL